MKYAKMENGRLTTAPKKVSLHGNTVLNPQPEQLAELGYLPVVYTDPPGDAPEGKYYEAAWKQTVNEIRQVWTLADTPVYEDPGPTHEQKEIELLKAQNEALSEQMDFFEDCVAEMASVIYE